jgi:hypothetical protein
MKNNDRINKTTWNEADIKKIYCPNCRCKSMKRGTAYLPVRGYYGYVACLTCDWRMEKVMK